MDETEKEAKSEKKISPDKTAIIFLSIAATIIAILVIVFLSMQTGNEFTYKGLMFEKTMEGKIAFYTVKVPAINSEGKITSYVKVDFRNDPRELNDVAVALTGNLIKFVAEKKVYVSIDKDMPKCNGDSILSMANLGVFLSIFKLNAEGVVNNPDYANKTSGIMYANCETNPSNTVIMFFPGNSTEITQTKENCYNIIVSNCESLKAVEKFELQVLEQYANSLGLNN